MKEGTKMSSASSSTAIVDAESTLEEKVQPEEVQPEELTLEQLEQVFDVLSEITDRISLMNSIYESNLEQAFDDLKQFSLTVRQWSADQIPQEIRRFYLSHLTFHREIIADIIAEARSLLMEERREYLKTLVRYHKDYCSWLDTMEKALSRS
ncbi:MAG TPA: hypothetical protein DEA96_10695 [Leptospiraceae bacterium]|nr:hypothetical protein [Spirochaetaceae bacterium]HBS05426.1 hypothetical protein [Leptospiraceae bacterium]|tara:strand:+ start:12625 stop:13080 length:456 start_codon:yes stop_codon:yes gene_type:complete